MPKLLRIFRFDLVIDGEGVSPETVQASDLCMLISEFEKAVLSEAGAHAKGRRTVSLVAIGEGSDALTLAVSDNVVPAVRGIIRAISQRKFDKLHPQAHAALHESPC